MEFKVKLLHDLAKAPTRAYDSNGYDLYALGEHFISPNETKIINCGFASELLPGYAGIIFDRSSMGAKEIHRFAGVVDSDYRGEWKVILHNFGTHLFEIKHQQKIAQVLIIKTEIWDILIVDELSETERGDKALGSSDLNFKTLVEVARSRKKV